MADPACPCCAGRRGGDIDELCDVCLEGWLSEADCRLHPQAPPADDFELLAANPASKLRVAAVQHAHGRAWPWSEAIAAARQACPSCLPSIACWRHAEPPIDLQGYDNADPALIAECVDGSAKERCTGTGGTTVIDDRGGMTASVCTPCVLARLGAAIPLEAATP